MLPQPMTPMPTRSMLLPLRPLVDAERLHGQSAGTSGHARSPEDVVFDKGVAEFAAGIMRVEQCPEVRQPWIMRPDVLGRHREHLPPMRPRLKWCKRLFKNGQNSLQRGPIPLEGKMEGY